MHITAIAYNQQQAQQAAEQHEGGAGMFVVPVYKDNEPAGYISAGQVSAGLYNALAALDDAVCVISDLPAHEFLAELGMTLQQELEEF